MLSSVAAGQRLDSGKANPHVPAVVQSTPLPKAPGVAKARLLLT
jgi:hypothetical protein